MDKTTSNESNSNAPNPQEPGVVKEKITLESALREEGIDAVFVARKLKDLLRAQGRQWNPKEGSWDKFEDYGAQLAALRELAKIYATLETKKDSKCPTVILVDIPRPGMLPPTTNRPQDGSK
jgi:hypothetical protein